MTGLYRIQTRSGDLYRASDGRTRFPYLEASTIAARIGGRVIK